METEGLEMSSTSLTTTNSPTDDTALEIKQSGFDVYFYGLAIIVPIGLVCNLFSIGIFVSATKFRRTSTGQYLIALAVVDALVLVGDMVFWMSTMDDRKVYRVGLSFVDTSDIACKLVMYWRYR
jgi:hypothetical protein